MGGLDTPEKLALLAPQSEAYDSLLCTVAAHCSEMTGSSCTDRTISVRNSLRSLWKTSQAHWRGFDFWLNLNCPHLL